MARNTTLVMLFMSKHCNILESSKNTIQHNVSSFKKTSICIREQHTHNANGIYVHDFTPTHKRFAAFMILYNRLSVPAVSKSSNMQLFNSSSCSRACVLWPNHKAIQSHTFSNYWCPLDTLCKKDSRIQQGWLTWQQNAHFYTIWTFSLPNPLSNLCGLRLLNFYAPVMMLSGFKSLVCLCVNGL